MIVRRLMLGLPCALLLLTGCAGQRETYSLLPGADGAAGSVVVTPRQGAPLQLEGAYASAVASAGQAPRAARLSPAEIEAAFADARSARPDAPVHFSLYFLEGSDALTPESQKTMRQVLEAVSQRSAPDIVVIGHTDRVGLLQDNDRLALRRAEKMREQLLARGLPADSVQAAGRGEREPVVPTADEVPEPRNRRVEMLVR